MAATFNGKKYDINGFPVCMNGVDPVLLVSSDNPAVLAGVYDYLRDCAGSDLLECQSLYGANRDHAFLFSFKKAPRPAVLAPLDKMRGRWQLLK